MNQQLSLDLGVPFRATLANFVPGRNGPLLFILARLAEGLRSERQLHLWGARGSGKTHLLCALGSLPGALYFSCAGENAMPPAADAAITLWCIDDVEQASVNAQAALFNLVNGVRENPNAALVTAAAAPPLGLSLREDLRTRLGWGPVFQLEALNDAERATALVQNAHARGITLSEDVSSYLLTHCSRDMPSLLRLLDALERFALERQRTLTLPLVREWLQHATAVHPVS